VLGLLIGHIADRYDRRVVVGTCQVIKALAAAAFALGTLAGFLNRDVMLAILFVSGTARAFETPTMHTLVPGIVPPELLQRAIAASSTASQTAIICGPAIGGLLYVFGASTVYLTCTAVFVLASILVSFIQMQSTPPDKKPVSVEAVFAGFRYIRHNPVVLGAISLDLFAVLFGGAVALLPALADERLHVGAVGIGWLRAAAGIGAALVTLRLAVRPVHRHVGRWLLGAVATFGVATIVLGLTRTYAIAFVAMLVLAGADSISVFVRATLVPLVTPASKRGRVLAVESVFIGASNELGAFESGVAGQILGPAGAVVLGGAATLAVALTWARAFPALRRVDRFPTAVEPDEARAAGRARRPSAARSGPCARCAIP
jgi:hypothetical protein